MFKERTGASVAFKDSNFALQMLSMMQIFYQTQVVGWVMLRRQCFVRWKRSSVSFTLLRLSGSQAPRSNYAHFNEQ